MAPVPTGDESKFPSVDFDLVPGDGLAQLSAIEVEAFISGPRRRPIQDLFRDCALAVLNTGCETDDASAMLAAFADFTISAHTGTEGLQLKMRHAPARTLIEGRLPERIKQHLIAVLRNVIYLSTEIVDERRYDRNTSSGITNAVLHILEHAGVLEADAEARLVVCWGGHSVSRDEYDYSEQVGYQLGVRRLDICTGCGPGAMQGPMQGAAAQAQHGGGHNRRLLGLTEPDIITAEPPNPLVNQLVILPDIEKRLEAFVRLGQGFVIFPGGVGTLEEILYLAGILLEPANADSPLPVVMTGPASSREYFLAIEDFLTLLFGDALKGKYQVILNDPTRVADTVQASLHEMDQHRDRCGDTHFFNRLLSIPFAQQQPFKVTHRDVAGLYLRRSLSLADLAVQARRVCSAVVTGNVKASGVRAVQEHGPYQLRADTELIEGLERVLACFARQGRMRLQREYSPCYTVVGDE